MKKKIHIWCNNINVLCKENDSKAYAMYLEAHANTCEMCASLWEEFPEDAPELELQQKYFPNNIPIN